MGRFKAFALALACGLLLAGCGQSLPAPGSSGPSRPVLAEGAQRQGPDEAQPADRPPMVRIDGALYLDTGKESEIGARCGMMDGEITSTVGEGQLPTEDNQSNFGTGYGYQYAGCNSIDIYMNQKWMRFVKEDTDLTLEAVLELAQKGGDLSWGDFASYNCIENGWGLYTRRYPINESLHLLIGGNDPAEKPLYIRLARTDDQDNHVDIRTGDIEAFLAGGQTP